MKEGIEEIKDWIAKGLLCAVAFFVSYLTTEALILYTKHTIAFLVIYGFMWLCMWSGFRAGERNFLKKK